MEKVIYYCYYKNRSVDVIVCVDGHDVGNYHIASYKAMRELYRGYKFYKI